MTTADIADWVFESVLQFLKSPMWTSPIEEFLEEHCTAFDPSESENKLEYTTLHNLFRDMVDDLLSSFLGELGVDIAAFVTAIKEVEESSGDKAFPEEQKEISAMLAEYLMAIDDFSTFRRMMECRTTEMEVEAMFEHNKYASAAAGKEAEEEDEEDDMDEDERFLVEMAIHASMGTEEMMMKQLAAEDAKLLKELAFQIAVEHEKALKELLAAEAQAKQEDDAALSAAAQEAMDAKKKEIEAEEANKIAALQAEVERQRAAKVEQTLEKLAAETKTQTQRKPLGDLVHGGAGATRGNCSVFGTQKSALPSLAPSTAHSATPAGPKPLSQLVSQKENEKPIQTTTAEPSADEIKQKEEYFKALGQKLRAKSQNNRQAEMADFAKKQGIENSTSTSGATTTTDAGTKLSEEQRRMRVELAMRFKEDLIQESRRAAA